MRLFVALAPPAEAVEHLRAAVAELPDAPAGVRWPAPDTWHLTLAFLGEVDDVRRSDLERRLARAAGRHPALELRVAGAGTFGSRSQARVLWAGVDVLAPERQGPRAPSPLNRLAESVQAGARRAGIEQDGRFRAHVTLARAKRPSDLGAHVELLTAYTGPRWRADHVELVRSRPGAGPGGGSAYETVGSFPLAD